jgi:hypothetical protein
MGGIQRQWRQLGGHCWRLQQHARTDANRYRHAGPRDGQLPRWTGNQRVRHECSDQHDCRYASADQHARPYHDSGADQHPGTSRYASADGYAGADQYARPYNDSGTNQYPGTNRYARSDGHPSADRYPGANRYSGTNRRTGADRHPGTNRRTGSDGYACTD